MDTNEIWTKTLSQLSQETTKATYNTILEGSRLISANGVYTIQAPSDISREWLEYRLRPIVARALGSVTDQVIDPAKLVFTMLQPGQLPAIDEDDDATPIYIRSKRKERRYYIDNEFILLGYAARVGPYAGMVYNVLCCRADNQTQTCYPGKQSIADDAGISLEECKRAIKTLEHYHLVHVLREKKGKGWKSNTYTLLDVSEWLLL